MKEVSSVTRRWLILPFLSLVFISCATMSSETAANRAADGHADKALKYPRHELKIACGVGANQADPSTHRFVDGFLDTYDMSAVGGCSDIFGDSYLVANMEYHYRIDRKWDLGALIAWGISGETYTDDNDYEHTSLDTPITITNGSLNGRSFSLAPSVRYTWTEAKGMRVFSRAALGMMRRHFGFEISKWRDSPNGDGGPVGVPQTADKKNWRMTYQVSALGVSFGAERVRLVAELGYGCLGVLNFGLCVIF